MSNAVDANRWQTYLLKRREGMSKSAAARGAGISRATVMRMERGDGRTPEYRRAMSIHADLYPKEPVDDPDSLPPQARRALNDFAYFRLRYMGRYSTPWQVHAAEQMVRLLDTDDREYVVVNVPPGSGKSTTFSHDIPCWLIVRNRAVRIMVGSATERLAKFYGARIRRTLERTDPVRNDSDKVAAGIMADATATLAADFGTFKPPNRDLWRSEEFVVEQPGGIKSDNKEPTVSTYGRDGGFLGGRFDFVIWDDLVTSRVLRTAEAREQLQVDWDGEFESRLEPGGVMVLQGQRLHANDLYRYCLDKRQQTYDDDGEIVEAAGDTPTYRHIVYKAHHDEVCNGDHGKNAKPYDPGDPLSGGCLLDPWRMPWRFLQAKRANNTDRFLVLYQQQDVDPADVLVDPTWISGGKNPETGEEFLGVWDEDRSAGVVPKGLTHPWALVVGADPSPTKYWSVQMWLMHVKTEQRILVDHYRGKLTAPDFLGWDINTATWTGLLEEWWQSTSRQGAPFRWVIVEQNAAQTFLLQYDHVKKWMAARGVQIIGHNTYGNKTSQDFGVYTVAPHWKYGRVRLPGNRYDGSRARSMALVNEVKQWPESSTEDCVMAHWMVEYSWQRMIRSIVARPAAPPRMTRPSWLGGPRQPAASTVP